jgi:hypothetical protein
LVNVISGPHFWVRITCMVDQTKTTSLYDRETNPHARPSRAGLKTIVTYVPPDLSKALKILAMRADMSLQDLGEKAFRLLIEHYGTTVEELNKPLSGVS